MDLVRAFNRYIKDTAGIDAVLRPRRPGGLPPFLRQRYNLYRIHVAGGETTGLLLPDRHDFSPAAFEKHLRHLPADVQRAYVLVAATLPAYVRNRLVARRIPFVVPGVQLHWPDLGVAFRGRRQGRPVVHGEQVSPATQAAIVSALAGALPDNLAAKDAARIFGYTRMTMTRVFNELEAAGLAETARHGHERRLRFALRGKKLWAAARPKLRDPVRRTFRFRTADVDTNRLLLAGESALAEATMLAPPSTPVCAVGPSRWAVIRDTGATEVPVEDADTRLLQVWLYEPALAGRDGRVDPFSLALSLQDTQDERVAGALEEMMGALAW